MLRTNNCGELTLKQLGDEVTLAGWVQKTRNKGFMIWVDLRDRYGITQIIFDEGIALVEKYDGEIPKRDLKFFLGYIDISEKEFWDVIDKYREISNVWKKVNGKWVMSYLPKKKSNF